MRNAARLLISAVRRATGVPAGAVAGLPGSARGRLRQRTKGRADRGGLQRVFGKSIASVAAAVIVAFGSLTASTAAAGGESGAPAPGLVRLELVGDPQGVGQTFHQWAEALDRAGIRNVRLRAAEVGEQPTIEKTLAGDRPMYRVVGIVLSHDELLLPGRRFKRSQVTEMKAWLDDLAARGPADQREAVGAFGLTGAQFTALHDDAAQPVGFATAKLNRKEVVQRIAQRLKHPLVLDPAAARLLAEDQLAEELQTLSAGTALAYVLRAPGCCLRPQIEGGRPKWSVVPARPGLEVWPVGWPVKAPNQALPGIFEFLNVNLQNAPAADALNAIAGRLNVPVLLDHNAVARHGLDVRKPVTVPPGRTTYSLALRKALSQAGLQFEIRADEADRPFLWVTSIKPM